jgi:ribosome-binding factor A
MPSRRVLKAAEAIREVVGMAILADLKDPRIRGVTVTFVEVAGDMRQAKIHVSIMGTEAERQLSLHGLQSSAGFLQKKIANRIDTRYTPRLEFVLDEGVKKSIEIARILREVLPEEASTASAAEPGSGSASSSAESSAESDLEESDLEESDLEESEDLAAGSEASGEGENAKVGPAEGKDLENP